MPLTPQSKAPGAGSGKEPPSQETEEALPPEALAAGGPADHRESDPSASAPDGAGASSRHRRVYQPSLRETEIIEQVAAAVCANPAKAGDLISIALAHHPRLAHRLVIESIKRCPSSGARILAAARLSRAIGARLAIAGLFAVAFEKLFGFPNSAQAGEPGGQESGVNAHHAQVAAFLAGLNAALALMPDKQAHADEGALVEQWLAEQAEEIAGEEAATRAQSNEQDPLTPLAPASAELNWEAAAESPAGGFELRRQIDIESAPETTAGEVLQAAQGNEHVPPSHANIAETPVATAGEAPDREIETGQFDAPERAATEERNTETYRPEAPVRLADQPWNNGVLEGGSGDDWLYGGSGRDLLFGYDGDDRLYGGNSRDFLSGGAGNDLLAGGHGDDLLLGGAGDDLLYGGSGRDTFYGGDGSDTLYGGADSDTYVIGADETGVDVIHDTEGRNVVRLDGFPADAEVTVALWKNGDLDIYVHAGGAEPVLVARVEAYGDAPGALAGIEIGGRFLTMENLELALAEEALAAEADAEGVEGDFEPEPEEAAGEPATETEDDGLVAVAGSADPRSEPAAPVGPAPGDPAGQPQPAQSDDNLDEPDPAEPPLETIADPTSGSGGALSVADAESAGTGLDETGQLVLTIDDAPSDGTLWAAVNERGDLEILLRGSDGYDDLLARVEGYADHPEALYAVEAGGESHTVADLVTGSGFGDPQIGGENLPRQQPLENLQVLEVEEAEGGDSADLVYQDQSGGLAAPSAADSAGAGGDILATDLDPIEEQPI